MIRSETRAERRRVELERRRLLKRAVYVGRDAERGIKRTISGMPFWRRAEIAFLIIFGAWE